VWSIAFSSDEKTLVSGGCGKFDKDTCVQGETILWDVIDRNASKQLVKLTNHTDHVQTVKFSPDGKVLASGSWDKIVILWNVENPANPLQDSIIKFGAIVRTLAFSPDGNTLAIGGDDLTVALWDITNPTAPTQLGELPTKHTNYIWSVAFSPDGKTLASGSLDNTVILWDVTKPKEPIQWGEPLSHPDYVLNVAFSPDKRTLVSTSCEKRDENKNCMQGDIFLWDVSSLATPIQIGQNLKGHTNEITSVAFSPNGKILASGRIAIILWDVDPQSWVVRACQKAGRNFTQPEWEKYFPGEDYRITCPQWPAGE
jgi:WD40 repeat protein